ncbi:MAG: glycosyltransferase family 2 protein [Thermoleophilia bacterium]
MNGSTDSRTTAASVRPASVWVVIVVYNSYADSRDCLASLAAATWPQLRVAVVDNGSSDGCGERLRGEFPALDHIRSDENLGFAGGCNVGIRAAVAGGADFICLLNNDTLVEPGFIEPLAARAVSEADAGVVGGKILYDGADRVIWFAGGEIDERRGFTRHRGQDEPDGGQYDEAGAVDYVTGCLFFVPASLFVTVGLFDERYFMYCEEVDFCLRVRRAGYRCFYEPAAVIRHRVSRSMGGAYRPLFYYYQTRNLLEVHRIAGGAGRGSLLTLRLWSHLVLGQGVTMLRAHRLRSLPYLAALWSGFFAYLSGRFGPRDGMRLKGDG